MCQQTVLGFCVSIKETFSNATTLIVINKYCKGALIQIATAVRYICHVVSLRVFWNRAFWAFISPCFSESVFPEIHQRLGPFSFGKCLKFNMTFKNAKKNREENFCFWDNCIWIGSVKLPLLSRWCFSSTVNVLTNSLRILCITKRDFFQCNYVQSD